MTRQACHTSSSLACSPSPSQGSRRGGAATRGGKPPTSRDDGHERRAKQEERKRSSAMADQFTLAIRRTLLGADPTARESKSTAYHQHQRSLSWSSLLVLSGWGSRYLRLPFCYGTARLQTPPPSADGGGGAGCGCPRWLGLFLN